MKIKTTKLKKLLCMAIAVIMAVSTMPLTVFAAQSSVSYRDAAWDGSKVVFSDKTATCTTVESSSSAVTWTAGWYAVSGDVTVSDTITVSGTVNLVLTDGCTLNAKKGIAVTSGNQLTVYGQTASSGKLIATGTYSVDSYNTITDIAGIGGNSYLGQSGSTCGTVIINGGNITASGGDYAAGIGGAGYKTQTHNGGNITINAGTVNARGGDAAAGIGGGRYGSGGNITINGGTVTANGAEYYGAGIGGGHYGKGGTTIINGGTVKATGGRNASGIGAGTVSSSGSGGTITIIGGDVTAQGGPSGSGIGSTSGNTGTITITGGKVRAVGGSSETGIGGRSCTGGNITISGGYVEALCDNASGIDRAQGIGGKSGVNFSTGENGTAVIIASNINDGTVADKSAWSGLIFEGSSGQLYSNELTLPQDLTVDSGKTLTIPEGAALTVPAGTTLKNNGTIVNNGKLIVYGTFSGNSVSGSGETVLPPALVDGVYQISTADELMWFADFVNSGNPKVNAKLTADIDLKGYDFKPIGISQELKYRGTFDGQNHTISNLKIAGDTKYVGFFGYVYEAAIRNFTIKGTVEPTAAFDYLFVGGVLAYVDYGSTVENIISYVDVTVKSVPALRVGGIAGSIGVNRSVIDRCINYGNVTVTQPCECVGGISGWGSNDRGSNCTEFTNIINYGNISSTCEDTYVGGIFGWMRCYQSTSSYSKLIKYAYNAGKVSAPTASRCGAVSGIYKADSDYFPYYIGVMDCYYLAGSAESMFGTEGVVTESSDIARNAPKTAEQFKSGEVAFLLGGAFGQKIGTDEYPVFGGDKVYSYKITNCDGAEVTKYSNDSTVTDIVKEHTFGEYTYDLTKHTKTCTQCGYAQSEDHTFGDWQDKDNYLHERTCSVCGFREPDGHNYGAWTTDGENHSRVCTDCGHIDSAAHNFGDWTTDGTSHTRTCADCGYAETTEHTYGEWTIDGETHSGICTVCGYVKSSSHHFSDWTDNGAVHSKTCVDCGYTETAEHTYGEWTAKAGNHSKECSVCGHTETADHNFGDWTIDSETHSCICTVCGYTESGAHTYSDWTADGDMHSAVCTVCGNKLSALHTFDDTGFCTVCGDKHEVHTFDDRGFCTDCGVYQPAVLVSDDYFSEYEISNAGQLMWFAKQVNSGKRDIHGRLAADIDLDGVAYTPIGTADQPYEGTFNGQNHTIVNMNITANSDNQGLFGYIQYARIYNMTVKGSIVCTASCAAVGGVVGFSYYSYLSNINSYVDITDTGVEMHHVGGVVGAARTSSTVRACMNYGNIYLTNAADCVGGVAGYANEYVTIMHSANCGIVHSDTSDAYIGGIVGYVNNNNFKGIESCYNAGSVENPTDTHCGAIIGWARSLDSSTIIGNYYLEGSSNVPFGTESVACTAEAKTAEQFKSGEVAYLLRQEFGQKIGQENYPVINSSTVYSYKITDCLGNSVTEYSNDSTVTDIKKGHVFGDWTIDSETHSGSCTVCGYTESGAHTYGDWTADGDMHSRVCTVCVNKLSEPHTFDERGFCTVCGDYEPAVYNSSSKEYEISNAGQLMWFAKQVNSGNKRIDGGLAADIDLDGVDYTPIGTAEHPYEGYFYGYGYTVSNMNITADSDYQGMFGYTYAARINMLTVKGAIICTESISAVGGVVGFADGTSIGNVNSYVNIADIGVELHRVGGIAGLLGKWSTVRASMNYGDINLTSTVDSVGGIIGYVNALGQISACANHGTIRSDAPDAYIGGILGCIDSTSFEGIFYSYNLGSVENPTDKYCGAITGWAKTIVSSEIFYNDYYLEGSANAPLGTESGTCTAQAKTAEQFKSGEVTYLMSEARYYGQEIGVQDYPVIDGMPVYRYENLACNGQSKDPAVYLYSNEQKENTVDEHSFVNGVCKVCGVYEDGLGAHLAGYTLSLSGNIGVNFHMMLSDILVSSETAYMQFTLPNGTVTKVLVKDAVKKTVKGTEYYVFSCEVAAKEMTDTITAQMFDGDKVGTVYTYTVKQYADYLFAHQNDNDEYARAAALIKSMVNYGSYAQVYFNNTENGLANDSEYVTEEEKDISSVTAQILEQYRNEETRENHFVKFEGSNLSLLSQTTLRLWFTIKDEAKLDSITFTCEGKALEAVKSGSYYYVEITDIAAKDLDKDYLVTVSDGTDSLDVHYSVMAYCYNVLSRETTPTRTQELKDTIAALYLYNVEANNYFGA